MRGLVDDGSLDDGVVDGLSWEVLIEHHQFASVDGPVPGGITSGDHLVPPTELLRDVWRDVKSVSSASRACVHESR